MRHKHNQYSEKIKEKIQEIFDHEHLDTLARQTGFIQRSGSRIEAKDMVELMTTEILPCATISLEGLCDSLHKINAEAEMTPHRRIKLSADSLFPNSSPFP
ncbi:MAG: hypothetical protein JETT_0820 [Candidatus Jettenia ecosi]|uniref:Uncharacterized protein n=1 Tax=Candidatus Jettenia ecosi TaxID=2494326 RepID=A0A533QQN7_9BACT|nr:MAG: hypothetical protein JETT_0820 [Candidatus Jettenia ecosi]